MRCIWEYEVLGRNSVPGTVTLRVPNPRGARGRSVAWRGGSLMLWLEVDSASPLGDYLVSAVATGDALDWSEGCEAHYIGTAFDGPAAWHVYGRPAA